MEKTPSTSKYSETEKTYHRHVSLLQNKKGKLYKFITNPFDLKATVIADLRILPTVFS